MVGEVVEGRRAIWRVGEGRERQKGREEYVGKESMGLNRVPTLFWKVKIRPL